MAETTSGITIEIDADASKFNKQMNSLRKETQENQKELDALQKSLELDFDESKFEKAQKVCQEAIDQTAERADALRQRLQMLEDSGNVDTQEYQKLETQLAQCELQGQQLEKQLEDIGKIKYDQLSNDIKEVGQAFDSAAKSASALAVSAAAAATALIASAVTTTSSANDLTTLSLKYGTTAEAIEQLNYVALQTNTDSNYLYKGLQKVQTGLADLASGATSNATEALQKLGLEFDSFDGTEDAFYAIIEALADMEDQTQMVNIASDIFGDTLATNLLPMIRSGSDAIEQYVDEFGTLGAMTNEEIASLAELQVALNKITTEFTYLKDEIGVALLPVLQEFVDIIEEKIVPLVEKVVNWFSNLSDTTKKVITVILLLIVVLVPMIEVIGKLIISISAIAKILPNIHTWLSKLAAHPIVLVIILIVALLVVLYMECEDFREAINSLISTIGDLLMPILQFISDLLKQILELLEPILEIIGELLADIINIIVAALQPVIEVLQAVFNILEPILNIALVPINAILTVLEVPLKVITTILEAIMPMITMITDLITMLLNPLSSLFSVLDLINSILEPLVEVVLTPIQIALELLEVPLQVLGDMLGWLSPLFEAFGEVISSVFQGVMDVINMVLGWVEAAVNFFIRCINGLIKAINACFGWLGVHINELNEISFGVSEEGVDELEDLEDDLSVNAYDEVNTNGTTGDIYNQDYSTNSTVQNVEVVINNYAAEIDVDNLIGEINRKLAEQM